MENKNTSDKVLSLTGVFFSYLHFATFFPLESLPIKNKPDNKYYYLNNPSYFYHFFINLSILEHYLQSKFFLISLTNFYSLIYIKKEWKSKGIKK